MTKFSNISKQIWSLAIALSVSTVAFAQSYYYDDDIYYDASKVKTEKKAAEKNQSVNRQSSYVVNGSGVTVADYPAADTYVVPAGSSLNIDVDTYNRRGQFLVSDTVYAENDGGGDFTFTQRIERFHNPDVVSGSDDEDLKEVYSYAMSQPQNINIYIVDNDPWNYYGPSWSWRYGNPWYWNAWYPSYSWGWNYWGWDPYWSWSWGGAWGPSWGWGPSYGPGWGPSWGWGPAQAWRPTTPSGSSRPHNYVGSGAIATHRPGSYSQSALPSSSSRPGNMGRGRYGSSSSVNSSARPGNYTPAATGSQNNSTVNSSRPGNQGRGRAVMNNSNNNSNQNNRNNYNNNSNNYRSSQSFGSFPSGGGSSSRGYSGSHGSAGGGGGSRGRR